MDILDGLDASQLKAVVRSYRDALRAHQEALNRLNVYPVPDGDTGTNMALTLESVVAEMEAAEGMAEVCKAITHGSLMGARGNSGVILSQILRAIASAFEGASAGTAADMAQALGAAGVAAYAAVMRPVEGTILTVARAAGEAAGAATGKLVDVLQAAKAAADDALARTPDLLPALKQAGVVDAGGAGYVLLLDAFLQVAAGHAIPAPPAPAGAGGMAAATVPSHCDGHGVAGLRYEVMYFLEAPDEDVTRFKEAWAAVGDSIVVVGGDGLWNCHIHTDDIGAAVEAGVDCGRPKAIRVTDLLEQVQDRLPVRDWPADAGETVPCAVVAVATGDGIRDIFHSLGVQQVVAGGQSMNPSTAQILEAVEAAPAGEVVILPNNRNIVAVAEQVAALTTKVVRVVPTRSVAEGFAALSAYKAQNSAEENAPAMSLAGSRVVTGEVTRAVRAAATEAGAVQEGDWLGVSDARVSVVAPDLAGAATALLDRLVTGDHDLVTIVEGEGASPADRGRITAWLAAHRPACEVEVLQGGQPLYPYLFSAE